MTNKIQKTSVKEVLAQDAIKERLEEVLGKNAPAFATSVIQIVNSSEILAKCDPISVVGAAMTAATLNMPLNNSLGFAYIVPYKTKQSDGTYRQMAQFQIGYKGFVQLAQRSGLFKTIHVTDVREGEIRSYDRLSGEIEFLWMQDPAERNKRRVVGYVAYFRLLNGFEKLHYMSVDELSAHGRKFSKTFAKNFGLWKDDFDAMAKKTTLKLLLSKYAPLSVDLKTAVITDQASFEGLDEENVAYVDNESVKPNHQDERLLFLIENAETQEELDLAKSEAKSEEYLELIKKKQKELNLKKQK